MKFEEIVNRMDLRRKSERGYIFPFVGFMDKVFLARKLVQFVEKNTKDNELRFEARKHLILVCVSAMETFFGNVVKDFVDNDWIAAGFLNYRRVKDIKFTLGELYEIDKKQISIGEIIAVSHSFQSLDTVNDIFSHMFDVSDFVSEVESFEVDFEGLHLILKDDVPNYREGIEKMIQLRHMIVHHQGPRKLGLRKLFSMYNDLLLFVEAAHLYILDKVPLEDKE